MVQYLRLGRNDVYFTSINKIKLNNSQGSFYDSNYQTKIKKIKASVMKNFFYAFLLLNTIFSFGQNFTVSGINYQVLNPNPNFPTARVRATSGLTGLVTIPTHVRINNAGSWYAVTHIGVSAFEGSTGITGVLLPNNVTHIQDRAFLGCTGLTNLNFLNSVTQIGMFAFNGCTGLTSVTFPNSITVIGYNSFGACTGLTSVSFPTTACQIAAEAFTGCRSITSLNIPGLIWEIGQLAFKGCTALQSVTVNWTTQLAINDNVFDGVAIANIPLFVPAGSETSYNSRSPWSAFKSVTASLNTNDFKKDIRVNIYPNPANSLLNISFEKDIQAVEIYSYQGQKVLLGKEKQVDISSLSNGIYMIRVEDINGNVATQKFVKE